MFYERVMDPSRLWSKRLLRLISEHYSTVQDWKVCQHWNSGLGIYHIHYCKIHYFLGENIELSLPVYISPVFLVSIFPLPDFRLTNFLFACLHTCAHMYLFLESYWSKQYNILCYWTCARLIRLSVQFLRLDFSWEILCKITLLW